MVCSYTSEYLPKRWGVDSADLMMGHGATPADACQAEQEKLCHERGSGLCQQTPQRKHCEHSKRKLLVAVAHTWCAGLWRRMHAVGRDIAVMPQRGKQGTGATDGLVADLLVWLISHGTQAVLRHRYTAWHGLGATSLITPDRQA